MCVCLTQLQSNTWPGSHNDVYADAFLRQFFYNHKVLDKELEDSAGEMNHDTASGVRSSAAVGRPHF